MNWESILYCLVAAALLYFLYNTVRNQKDAFSSTNILKSLYTLGILALCLIAFITYCVWMLKSSESF
jgi:hypothetical protein